MYIKNKYHTTNLVYITFLNYVTLIQKAYKINLEIAYFGNFPCAQLVGIYQISHLLRPFTGCIKNRCVP